MRFTKFVIRNFKGIKHAELDMNASGQSKIFTLVGLNESGKTTILEAINSFSPDTATELMVRSDSDVFRQVKEVDLIPKHRKANFTGNVEVEASLELSDDDKIKIKNYLMKKHLLQLALGRLENTFTVTKIFSFENSDYQRQ